MSEDTTNLDQTEALFLGQARAGLGPTAAERNRMLGRLAAGFAQLSELQLAGSQPEAGPLGSGGAGEDLPSAARLYSQKMLIGSVIGAAALGFGAGVLLAGGLALTGKAERQSPRQEPMSVQAAGQDVLPTSGRSATDDAIDLDKLSAEDDRVDPPPRVTARAPLNGRPTAAPAPALYDELSHVRRAQMALKQGNAGLALGLMLSLDETQPGGALLAERSVTKVLALCQLGREDEATQLARAVLSKGDASVYRQRLSGSCAHLESTVTND